MRLFVGIKVPEQIAQALAHVQLPANARAVVPEDMHVTLVFLGEVPEGRLPALLEALGEVHRAPFEVRLGDGAAFSTALVMDVEPSAPLLAIQADIAARLEALGFPREQRAYRPHVTLARTRFGRGGSRVPPPESAAAGTSFRPEAFTLYRSRSAGPPPRYEQLTTWPLHTGLEPGE